MTDQKDLRVAVMTVPLSIFLTFSRRCKLYNKLYICIQTILKCVQKLSRPQQPAHGGRDEDGRQHLEADVLM